MKVFISWSGQLSKNLAEAFKVWLPGVIQVVKPYYSPDDISKGSRWSSEIAKELDSSKVGIICLTKENLHAPWIMFEAGALSKNLDRSKLCPILFEVEPSDIEGPLVQFQSARFSKDEIRRVLKMMNDELGDKALPADVLENVFEMWWPKLKENVEKILKDSTIDHKKTHRSERDILEEILGLTRNASISKNRIGADVVIHPDAIRDLVKGYVDIAGEIGLFLGIADVHHVLDALRDLEKPIAYIIRHSDLPEFERRKFADSMRMMESELAKAYESTRTENKAVKSKGKKADTKA